MTQLGKATQDRHNQLLAWLQPWINKSEPTLTQVAGDASFRRYYRLPAPMNRLQKDLIVMDAPPEQEDSSRFLHLAEAWRQQGIFVPQLHAGCEQQGFALLEDFGDLQLMQAVSSLTPEQADPWYRQALKQLADLQQQAARQANHLPVYDTALLERELRLFEDWLLQGFLGLKPQALPATWKTFCEQLLHLALTQPQVAVHRDYHSRNLMVTTDGHLGILDFQDAVLGPCTYDAVSLIRDCYLDWPQEWQSTWLAYFQQLSHPEVSPSQFIEWFDHMGMQRHLKAAGIFARLHLRDNKPAYLQDLPLTLKHLTRALKKYPQWADITEWIEHDLLPEVNQR